ncbi:hypothetical protein FRB99_000434 [Tulasnella sp. 403]|nr:hypothetical protein FRB99_000434 [Tulasnella sp. 403]
MPTKKASTSLEPAPHPLSQTFEAPSADSIIVSTNEILYPPIFDPGWKFKLSFLDSYYTCHEKLVPYFEFMREYIILNQSWIPSRHIMAFRKLHSEWDASMDAPPAKGFWKQELISQRGHTLVYTYWSQLKELRQEMSRRATSKAVDSIMAERDVIEDLARLSVRPQDTSADAGPSMRKSPPPFDGDDMDSDKGLESLGIDAQTTPEIASQLSM